MPPLALLNVFDRIAPYVWKKNKGSRPANKVQAIPFHSRRTKIACSQGGFPLGKILDLQKPGMSISGFASRR